MISRENQEHNDTLLYSAECEDSPLNVALDTQRLLVGGQDSTKCNHMSSTSAANQNAATSAYDPATFDKSNSHSLTLKQVPKSPSNDHLLLEPSTNMNNSMTVSNPNDSDFAQTRVRRGSKRLTACTRKEFLLILLCAILFILLIILLILYLTSFKCKFK